MSGRPGRKPPVNNVNGLTTTTWPPRRDIAGVFAVRPCLERHLCLSRKDLRGGSSTDPVPSGPLPRGPTGRSRDQPDVTLKKRVYPPAALAGIGCVVNTYPSRPNVKPGVNSSHAESPSV